MSDDATKHEQTIEPIRPNVSRRQAESGTPRGSIANRNGHKLWPIAVTIALVVGLGTVFFVLPDVVEESAQTATESPPESTVAPVDATPQLSAEQVAELERQIQNDLADLLTQQDTLEELAVEEWGAADWERYLTLSRAGDDAYLADDYSSAASAYRQALALGRQLLEEQRDLVSDALTAGAGEIDAGNWEEALRQYNTVLRIEPDNATAQRGKRRAERLPEVLELTSRAEQSERAGALPDAIDDFRAALAVDRDWQPAREGLDRAQSNLARYEFEQALSNAYAALSESSYRDAIEHFNAALAMRPESDDARDGLFQAEEGLRLGQIALAEIRALAFERRELWAEAIAQYQGALETDPTLQYAIDGLARSQQRQDLELKIVNIIENPRLLFDDQMLGAANDLLDEAAAIPEKGQRISDQIDDLTRLIRLATTPQRIVLQSDALTEITLYRVGTLGAFSSKEIELRPGNYTAVGSRNGYRDVRLSFTVLPGREHEPIRIVCVEPI